LIKGVGSKEAKLAERFDEEERFYAVGRNVLESNRLSAIEGQKMALKHRMEKRESKEQMDNKRMQEHSKRFQAVLNKVNQSIEIGDSYTGPKVFHDRMAALSIFISKADRFELLKEFKTAPEVASYNLSKKIMYDAGKDKEKFDKHEAFKLIKGVGSKEAKLAERFDEEERFYAVGRNVQMINNTHLANKHPQLSKDGPFFKFVPKRHLDQMKQAANPASPRQPTLRIPISICTVNDFGEDLNGPHINSIQVSTRNEILKNHEIKLARNVKKLFKKNGYLEEGYYSLHYRGFKDQGVYTRNDYVVWLNQKDLLFYLKCKKIRFHQTSEYQEIINEKIKDIIILKPNYEKIEIPYEVKYSQTQLGHYPIKDKCVANLSLKEFFEKKKLRSSYFDDFIENNFWLGVSFYIGRAHSHSKRRSIYEERDSGGEYDFDYYSD